MHETSPHLDGAYAAFGKITEGLDVIDKIAKVPTGFRDSPLEDQVIATIVIDLSKCRENVGVIFGTGVSHPLSSSPISIFPFHTA